MRFSEEFIERVRTSANIVDFVSQFVSLKKAGANYVGLCPFPSHKEKTPSFNVSESRQIYKCFGCKRGGNIFRFLSDYQGMNFPDAIELLAQRAGIPVPKDYEEDADLRDSRVSMKRINQFAGAYFADVFEKLPESHPAKNYAKKRGLTDELCRTFRIGLASDAWDTLALALNRKKAPLEVAESLGLIRRRKEKDGYFDLFRNRLMFPILSIQGEVLGFGGRTLSEVTSTNPKYLNSPESPLFHKGQTFYGIHETGKHIRSLDQAIIVEGYMDLVMVYKAGIQNLLATLGTALTVEHARQLRRMTSNVVLLFDGDSAGQAAADRSLPILLAEGIAPKVVFLPGELDPDDFIQEKGVDELRKLIDLARDQFLDTADKLIRKFGLEPAAKVRILDDLSKLLRMIPDSRLRDLYLTELSRRLDLAPAWIQKSLQQGFKGAAPEGPKKVTEKAPERPFLASEEALPLQRVSISPRTPKEELLILKMALIAEEQMKQLIDSGGMALLTESGARDVLSMAVQRYQQKPSDFDKLTAYLSSFVENSGELFGLDEGLNDLSAEQGRRLMQDCLQKLKNRHLKNQAKSVIRELKSEKDPAKLEQIVNIVRSRQPNE